MKNRKPIVSLVIIATAAGPNSFNVSKIPVIRKKKECVAKIGKGYSTTI
jgi:hypothetical protein